MASWLDLVFGDTPQVAPYISTDFTQEQLAALQQNIQNWPQIQQLGNLYQQYMLGGLENVGLDLPALTRAGAGLAQQEQAQAAQLLGGNIPQDVADQVRRSTAYQSLMAGTSGSPMAQALTARDLGLTSLDLIQRGAGLEQAAGNAAQRWAGLAQGTQMNPSGFMVTPQQRAALDMQNRLYHQATKQLRYNIAAMPDPRAAGISGTIMNLLGAYLGHGMGGGGNITPNYSSIMGGTGGGTGPVAYGTGFGSYGSTAGGMGVYGPTSFNETGNPGFGANFSAGYQGQPTQGLGGTLGGWWGNMFNSGY